MEPSLFLSMLGFLWVAAITPGPNNLLLTTSGANFGFMRSLWLMVGIMLGMQSILLLVAFGVGSLILVYPSLHLILKILGSLYLLWLAWKVATAAYENWKPTWRRRSRCGCIRAGCCSSSTRKPG